MMPPTVAALLKISCAEFRCHTGQVVVSPSYEVPILLTYVILLSRGLCYI